MSMEELLRFISRIIACGKMDNIQKSLVELKNILIRENAKESLINHVDGLIAASPEAAALGREKKGAPVTKEETRAAIRKGRERIRREEMARC